MTAERRDQSMLFVEATGPNSCAAPNRLVDMSFDQEKRRETEPIAQLHSIEAASEGVVARVGQTMILVGIDGEKYLSGYETHLVMISV